MAGKHNEAMDVFGKTLLLVTQAQAYGVPGQKYMLQLRGVFPNTNCRREAGEAQPFDEEAREAIRRTMKYAKPWLKA